MRKNSFYTPRGLEVRSQKNRKCKPSANKSKTSISHFDQYRKYRTQLHCTGPYEKAIDDFPPHVSRYKNRIDTAYRALTILWNNGVAPLPGPAATCLLLFVTSFVIKQTFICNVLTIRPVRH